MCNDIANHGQDAPAPPTDIPELVANVCAICTGPVSDDDLCGLCGRFICETCDPAPSPAYADYHCEDCTTKKKG